jgi:hypothetical protein
MQPQSSDAHLDGLGIRRENVRTLLLLPVAYVAWASRRRDLESLDALLEAAVERAHLDVDCLRLAQSWLRREPESSQLMAGLERLEELSRAPDEPLFTASDLLVSVVWASSAAQLDRESSGLGQGPVSSGARRAIRELEAHLGVDIGDLWADVLAELGEELPRSGNLLPPRFHMAPESSRSLLMGNVVPTLADLTPPLETITFEHAGPASIPFPLMRRAAS